MARLKQFGSNNGEVAILEYPGRPRYEVRLWRADLDKSRALLTTDQLAAAEREFQRAIREEL